MSKFLECGTFEPHLSGLRAPSPAFSRKSVLSWIENLPPPKIDSTQPVRTSTTKRKRASLAPASNDRVLRPRRQGPAANAMSAKQSPKKQGTGRQQRQSTRSQGLAGKSVANEHEYEHTEESIEDVEDTPPPARGGKVAMNAPRMQPSSEDSSSRASCSPTKMSALRNLKNPHSYEMVSSVASIETEHPLHELMGLWEDLSEISNGIAIIPENMEVSFFL